MIADQLARADVPAHLFLRQLPESPPYAVGLDGLFWVGFRSLCATLFHGCLDGLADFLIEHA